MSAVYHSSDFTPLYNKNFNAVVAWFKNNPGKSIEDCATAIPAPYEIVYTICDAAGLKILPNTSGELQFGPPGPGGPGRP